MTQDQELFELCKKVHEVTGWNGNLGLKSFPEQFEGGMLPYYSSEYILGKLPPKIKGFYQYFSLKHLGGAYGGPVWTATYGKGMNCYGDTPLEVLLKLVLAIHKAGKLK